MNAQKDNNSRNACVEFCVGLLVYLSFAISFGILTNDVSYYKPCSTTSSSYQWSRTTFIFLCIGTVFSVAVSPILRIIILKTKDSSPGCTAFLSAILLIVLLALAVFSLVCFGGLCHAYGQNENCGSLNTLILAYIIVVAIGLGMGVLGCFIGICVVMCCFGGALFGAQNQNNAGVVNVNAGASNDNNNPTNPDAQAGLSDIEQQKVDSLPAEKQ